MMPGPLASLRYNEATLVKKRIDTPGALAPDGAAKLCVYSSLANPAASHVLVTMTNPQSPLHFHSAVLLAVPPLLYFACILAGRNAGSQQKKEGGRH